MGGERVTAGPRRGYTGDVAPPGTGARGCGGAESIGEAKGARDTHTKSEGVGVGGGRDGGRGGEVRRGLRPEK